MGLAKSLRLGAVVVLILSVQLAQYQSFAKKHDEETTDTSATAPATSAWFGTVCHGPTWSGMARPGLANRSEGSG